ncbi:MAG TPA: alpha/beta hydrolase [Acidimicrobiia bacterium]|jgi:acetyl esterase/lipase
MTMDVAATIDAEIAAALAESPMGAIDFGTFTFEAMPAMREAMANMPPVELPATTTESHEVVVPGATGFDPTVRVYSPPTKAAGRPCIYWIHGGGYMFGSGLNVDARINRWVEEFDCVAVSIEYRLAPEDPYPAPLDDCYAGLLWIAQHADELGVDPNRIVVAGASAGAGLAAGLAILARDRGEVSLAFQLLIYPMIDDSNTSASSQIEGAPVWSRAANDLGWRAYLGDLAGTDDIPAYAAPARVDDVAGLPPAWIGVGTLDVFRDEDITYASRLLAAGIPTELHVYPGAVHGFEMIVPTAGIAQACQRDITEGLRRALRPAPRPVSVDASTS